MGNAKLGGHFYSLKTISDALEKKYNIHIIYLYRIKPDKSMFLTNCTYVKYTGFNVLETYKYCLKIINNFNPNYLHAFDYKAFVISQLLSNKTKIPLVFTKCGGPNPNRYYPYAKNFCLFSKENYDYFITLDSYKKCNMHLLPNRVCRFDTNYSLINELTREFPVLKSKRVILQIVRISTDYEGALMQSMRLVRELNKESLSFVLLIIGNMQNKKVYLRLNEAKDDSILFVTDDKYTKNAKQLIDIAYMVVGTGRGFMEACSKNKHMLIPHKEHCFPLFVTEESFQTAFKYNFSPRFFLKNYNDNTTIQFIQNIVNKKISPFSERWFNEYFSLELVEKGYEDLYNSSKFYKYSIIQFLKNMIMCMREFFCN